MKKYIYTETQIKSVIDSLMTEQVIEEQQLHLLKLKDLAEMVSRLGVDYDIMLQIFIDTYKKEGSEGVIRIFNSATDLDLEDFGYGRFHIKH